MMNQSINPLSKTLFSLTIASAMLMVSGGRNPVQASQEPTDSHFLISLEFRAPNDIAPKTTGGGVRGSIQFAAPGDDRVRDTAGGGVRGNVQFATPGEAAPSRVVGGGVRGNVEFSAPGDATVNTQGGGVRGNVEFSAPGDATVNTQSGGVRGNVEFATPGEAAPSRVVGGGVRGNVEFSAPGNDAPIETVSGGVRGEELSKVIPLMPASNYGRTISGRPTFFVYVPPTASKEVFFSLQDADRHHHYQTTLTISGKGGIVEVTLPDDAPELEIGQEYVWFFAPLAADGILRPDNYGVTGWVKRVNVESQSDYLSSLNPIELATFYAKEGIWYDTLQVLSAAKLTHHDDATLASEWKDLLEQVELEAIATEPIDERL